MLCLSACHSNCIVNLFSSYRWIPEVEEFQLSSRNSSGIDCLSCFSSFIGPLHSLGNDPFSTCSSPEQLRKLCYETINHISSKETFFSFFFFPVGPAASGHFTALPFQARPLPCLLGPQLLGFVQRRGQSAHSCWYSMHILWFGAHLQIELSGF